MNVHKSEQCMPPGSHPFFNVYQCYSDIFLKQLEWEAASQILLLWRHRYGDIDIQFTITMCEEIVEI